jgi:hypothetical protein
MDIKNPSVFKELKLKESKGYKFKGLSLQLRYNHATNALSIPNAITPETADINIHTNGEHSHVGDEIFTVNFEQKKSGPTIFP